MMQICSLEPRLWMLIYRATTSRATNIGQSPGLFRLFLVKHNKPKNRASIVNQFRAQERTVCLISRPPPLLQRLMEGSCDPSRATRNDKRGQSVSFFCGVPFSFAFLSYFLLQPSRSRPRFRLFYLTNRPAPRDLDSKNPLRRSELSSVPVGRELIESRSQIRHLHLYLAILGILRGEFLTL